MASFMIAFTGGAAILVRAIIRNLNGHRCSTCSYVWQRLSQKVDLEACRAFAGCLLPEIDRSMKFRLALTASITIALRLLRFYSMGLLESLVERNNGNVDARGKGGKLWLLLWYILARLLKSNMGLNYVKEISKFQIQQYCFESLAAESQQRVLQLGCIPYPNAEYTKILDDGLRAHELPEYFLDDVLGLIADVVGNYYFLARRTGALGMRILALAGIIVLFLQARDIPRQERSRSKYRDLYRRFYSSRKESIEKAPFVQQCAKETFELGRTTSQWKDLQGVQGDHYQKRLRFRALIAVCTEFSIIPILLNAAATASAYDAEGQKTNLTVDLANLAIAVSACDMIQQCLGSVPTVILKGVDLMERAMEMGKLLAQPSPAPENAQALPLQAVSALIEFRDVSFTYPGNKRVPVFHGLNLTIRGGEKTALVGSTGCGKTTLIGLLQRRFDPSNGEIRIDDQDIKSVTKGSLCRNISFMAQESQLFNRSTYDNVIYPCNDNDKDGAPSIEDVEDVCKQVGLHKTISQREGGYTDFLIGENGSKLSGGQTQLLCAARLLLRLRKLQKIGESHIVILDEPTSGLDSITEQAVFKNILGQLKNETVIIIAHRLSTVVAADRIVVLDKGRIIEDGTHSELLLRKSGEYARLWRLQTSGVSMELE